MKLLEWLDGESGALGSYGPAIIWLLVIVGGLIIAGARLD